IMTPAQSKAVQDYIEATSRKSEVDRKATTDKTGVFTGAYAVHPISGEKIPLWIADYVLTDYGTGAIMAVPGHDARDFEFATKFKLPVKRVLEGGDALPFEGEGTLVNSDFLNGLSKTEAIKKMLNHLEEKKLGTREVQYKLRDWLFSRQRYWGEPFPIVHYADGSRGVPVNELPVVLPEVADYEPADTGEAPLARNAEWVHYKSGSKEGRRETDTMPGAAGSSWYFLRYIEPHNDKAAVSPEAEKYWMPVDLYVGGPEHTVGHLLYSRFWMKVLFDVGLVTHTEPFQKLLHQGMILGPDGEKMSKSRGNVISPEDIAKTHGADAMRAFICFMGPVDKDKPWAPTGIDGVKRFLDRLTRLVVSDDGQYVATKAATPEEVKKLVHKTIKKVTDDIESMSFNTAISAMMILVNELYKAECRSEEALKPLVQILAPFAPHLAEELWEKMGGEGLCSLAPWPKYDNTLVADNTVTIGVQVNGKMRGTIEISPTASEPEALAAANAVPGVASALAGKSPDKVIYKAGKILNLIVK
ncbi:MAG TPA: leucine--tRNA ligase, partial [Bdellovibrio sp.]